MEASTWMESVPPFQSLWRPQDLTVEALIDDVAQGHYFLISAGKHDDPMGTFQLTTEDSVFWQNMPGVALYIHRIAIRRQYAQNTSGVSLIPEIFSFAERQARMASAGWLRLDCDRTRTQLCELYERHGFQYHSDVDLAGYAGVRYQRKVAS